MNIFFIHKTLYVVTLVVKKSTEEFILDLQELREILNKIFPIFISYTIVINNFNLFRV